MGAHVRVGCVGVCICMWGCRGAHAHVCSLLQMPKDNLMCPSGFWGTCRVGWLAIEPQGCTWLHLPALGLHTHATMSGSLTRD